jgi:hypothetical protein
MSLFRKDDLANYDVERPKVLAAYVENMVAYLHGKHPEVPEDKLRKQVKAVVIQRLNRPKAQLVAHPEPGVSREVTVDLLDYCGSLGNRVLTPMGAQYKPTSEESSVLRDVLDRSVRRRNEYKEKMLQAAAVGDAVNESLYHIRQASTKIFNNSIPGAMGSIYSFLYDLAGYNAITTVGQQCVKIGYSHTERMVAGNLYLRDANDVINYCTLLQQVCPVDKVNLVMEGKGFHYPTVSETTSYFTNIVSRYTGDVAEYERVAQYVTTLSDAMRAYVIYTYSFYNLLTYNDAIMRSWVKRLFKRDIPVDESLDPKDIFKVEGDLLNMVKSRNFDVIRREPDLGVAIDHDPKGVQALLSICRHVESVLNDWSDVFSVFFVSDVDLPRVWMHPDMIRSSVATSDTDSVIFSARQTVEWYTPNDLMGDDAIDMSALTVYMVSQTLEHLFARMTTNMGVAPEDRGRIKMKNEFYYPIFITSYMAKHYAGLIVIQEGAILPNPKLDIKGKNYRGSDIPAVSHLRFEEFVKDTIAHLSKTPSISGRDLLRTIGEHEKLVYTSLMAGEKTYLPTTPVNRLSDYEADPLRTNYLYYMLWEAVFKDEFGDFQIPNKGYALPVRDKGKYLMSEDWLDQLKSTYPDMYDRLMAFVAEHPTKSFSRLIIPPSLATVPDIIRPLIDVRHVLFTNDKPFALFVSSFNLSYTSSDSKLLARDYMEIDGMPEIPL